jgi:hypothetical protein
MDAPQGTTREQRRFLVINYWIGSRDDGILDGPVLVSTRDYEHFHLWDEPYAAALSEAEYQIIELYPRGMTFEEAARRFAGEFPWAVALMPDERLPRDAAFWLDVVHQGVPRRILSA